MHEYIVVDYIKHVQCLSTYEVTEWESSCMQTMQNSISENNNTTCRYIQVNCAFVSLNTFFINLNFIAQAIFNLRQFTSLGGATSSQINSLQSCHLVWSFVSYIYNISVHYLHCPQKPVIHQNAYFKTMTIHLIVNGECPGDSDELSESYFVKEAKLTFTPLRYF